MSGSSPERPDGDRPARSGGELLARALRRARWSIFWERLWPALATIATAIGLFLALSWLGLWLWLPSLGRAISLLALGALALAAMMPLLSRAVTLAILDLAWVVCIHLLPQHLDSHPRQTYSSSGRPPYPAVPSAALKRPRPSAYTSVLSKSFPPQHKIDLLRYHGPSSCCDRVQPDADNRLPQPRTSTSDPSERLPLTTLTWKLLSNPPSSSPGESQLPLSITRTRLLRPLSPTLANHSL